MINLCDIKDDRYQLMRAFAADFSKAYDALPGKLPNNRMNPSAGVGLVVE
jgi:hypothetical protein